MKPIMSFLFPATIETNLEWISNKFKGVRVKDLDESYLVIDFDPNRWENFFSCFLEPLYTPLSSKTKRIVSISPPASKGELIPFVFKGFFSRRSYDFGVGLSTSEKYVFHYDDLCKMTLRSVFDNYKLYPLPKELPFPVPHAAHASVLITPEEAMKITMSREDGLQFSIGETQTTTRFMTTLCPMDFFTTLGKVAMEEDLRDMLQVILKARDLYEEALF